MRKRYFLGLSFGLLVCLLPSCTRGVYPGFYTPRMLGPRMIQPIPNNGNENVLPQDANFVQSYPNYHKSKTNSKFGALVRVIEFEYDIAESFSIIPRITSGYDEGEMTGLITIVVDQFELSYENKETEVREYVEVVSYESSRPVQQTQQVYNPATTDIIVSPEGEHTTVHNPGSMSTIYNSIQEKQNQVVNRSQLYNSTKYRLEDEDVKLIFNSKTLSYIIHLQNATISIYPTKEQIRILKRMIQKHYQNF